MFRAMANRWRSVAAGLVSVSALLVLSGAPFMGPIGACRVGFEEGEYTLNPRQDVAAAGALDRVAAGLRVDEALQPRVAHAPVGRVLPRPVLEFARFDLALARPVEHAAVVVRAPPRDQAVLDREIAKERIMGRRLCANDNNHPNHIAFEAIKPVEKDGKLVCRVCGGELSARADDQDEEAINKRHNIYYDTKTGTTAAVNYFKKLPGTLVISVDGSLAIKEVSELIMKQLP